jgi:hypothetical protein
VRGAISDSAMRPFVMSRGRPNQKREMGQFRVAKSEVKCFVKYPVMHAGSGRRRNTYVEFTRRSLESEGFSRALVQAQRDLVELRLRIRR